MKTAEVKKIFKNIYGYDLDQIVCKQSWRDNLTEKVAGNDFSMVQGDILRNRGVTVCFLFLCKANPEVDMLDLMGEEGDKAEEHIQKAKVLFDEWKSKPLAERNRELDRLSCKVMKNLVSEARKDQPDLKKDLVIGEIMDGIFDFYGQTFIKDGHHDGLTEEDLKEGQAVEEQMKCGMTYYMWLNSFARNVTQNDEIVKFQITKLGSEILSRREGLKLMDALEGVVNENLANAYSIKVQSLSGQLAKAPLLEHFSEKELMQLFINPTIREHIQVDGVFYDPSKADDFDSIKQLWLKDGSYSVDILNNDPTEKDKKALKDYIERKSEPVRYFLDGCKEQFANLKKNSMFFHLHGAYGDMMDSMRDLLDIRNHMNKIEATRELTDTEKKLVLDKTQDAIDAAYHYLIYKKVYTPDRILNPEVTLKAGRETNRVNAAKGVLNQLLELKQGVLDQYNLQDPKKAQAEMAAKIREEQQKQEERAKFFKAVKRAEAQNEKFKSCAEAQKEGLSDEKARIVLDNAVIARECLINVIAGEGEKLNQDEKDDVKSYIGDLCTDHAYRMVAAVQKQNSATKSAFAKLTPEMVKETIMNTKAFKEFSANVVEGEHCKNLLEMLNNNRDREVTKAALMEISASLHAQMDAGKDVQKVQNNPEQDQVLPQA